MITKIREWFLQKSVKREVIRECERTAIKHDFDAELNKHPAADLDKEAKNLGLRIKDLVHEADDFEAQATAIEADETMDKKLRYDKARELRDAADKKRNEAKQTEGIIKQCIDGVAAFKNASAQHANKAQAHRVKAEFIRNTF